MKIRNFINRFSKVAKQVVVVVGIIATVFYIVNNYSIHQVSGHSMDPTFQDGDLILVKLTGEPQNMDVVVLTTTKIDNYENDPGNVIKRYYEDYSTDGYFVLGDNSEVSYDSRYYGEAPKEALQGIVVFDISKGFRSLVAAISNLF